MTDDDDTPTEYVTTDPRGNTKRHLFNGSKSGGNHPVRAICGNVRNYGPFEAYDPAEHDTENLCRSCRQTKAAREDEVDV